MTEWGDIVTIQKFKEIVKTWDNYEESFKKFRIWAVNFYKQWLKDRDIAWTEEEQQFRDADDFIGSEEYEKHLYQWAYVSPEHASLLYSKLGIEIEKELKDKVKQYSADGVLFYAEDFKGLFDIVNSQDDNIKFCYGLLVLMSGIAEDQMIYQHYLNNVQKGLKEFGLEKCQKLIGCDTKKVFFAMWFDDKMGDAKVKIKEAIKHTGYEPVFINDKEYNGQIVPEIFKEIDDSLFVIADLTGQRGGVYYEAGYAMAREKQVILCCRKEETTHFDVAQINTIYWENQDDLYKRLVDRIKATIGVYM